jgi:plastocyanin
MRLRVLVAMLSAVVTAVMIFGPAAQAGAVTVRYGVFDGYFYYPMQTAVSGDDVVWENLDGVSHRIVAYDSVWTDFWGLDVTVAAGDSHERTVRVPGVYGFRDPARSEMVSITLGDRVVKYCSGMCGVLRVR